MKALILAAGEAKRLKPITENLPKCMLRVGEKSIISYQIDALLELGITDVVVVTGFLAERLEEYLTKMHPATNFTFIRSADYYKTYPAHGLWLAREHIAGTILYLNADVIFHPDILKRVIDAPAAAATALHKNDWDEEQVNVIVRSGTDQVLSMGKHISTELSTGEFIGVTKLGPQFNEQLVAVLEDFINREETKKFAADAINLTIQRGEHMSAIDVTSLPAIEIDTREDLLEAETTLATYFS